MKHKIRVRLLIIGDEIISSKRQDRHLKQANELLKPRGLALSGVMMLGDDPVLLQAYLESSFASGDAVFCFGGIGATPDDRTRQCAALALNLPIERHPQAVAEIEAQFGDAAYPQRVHMAEYPKGAEIIPNFYNRVPGFSIQNHHFMPGFPMMAKPMMEWVLDHLYTEFFQEVRVEKSIRILEGQESAWISFMQQFEQDFPCLRLFSLPSILEDGSRSVELGVEGCEQEALEGLSVLVKEAEIRQCEWHYV